MTTLEPNFIEIPLAEKESTVFTPQPNTPAVPSPKSNVAPAPNGSVLNGGSFYSPNFSKGVAGWAINAAGDAEFNDGTFRGAVTASTIDIGGSDATSFHVDADGNLWLGDALFASAPFKVSNAGALTATGATISGAISGSTIDIGGADATSFHVDVDGNMWLGAALFADGPFKVSNAGAATASSLTITGGSIAGTTTVGIGNVNLASRGWTQTCVFSVTDADTVAWAAGSFISADGTTYTIDAGNTGNMAAATYIYLDIAVSTTAYQTTTTASTAVGAGKVLLAKAQNGTGEATFQVFGGIGGQNINASSIVANSITANELSTSITYAGSIVVDTS